MELYRTDNIYINRNSPGPIVHYIHLNIQPATSMVEAHSINSCLRYSIVEPVVYSNSLSHCMVSLIAYCSIFSVIIAPAVSFNWHLPKSSVLAIIFKLNLLNQLCRQFNLIDIVLTQLGGKLHWNGILKINFVLAIPFSRHPSEPIVLTIPSNWLPYISIVLAILSNTHAWL